MVSVSSEPPTASDWRIINFHKGKKMKRSTKGTQQGPAVTLFKTNSAPFFFNYHKSTNELGNKTIIGIAGTGLIFTKELQK